MNECVKSFGPQGSPPPSQVGREIWFFAVKTLIRNFTTRFGLTATVQTETAPLVLSLDKGCHHVL